MCPSAPIVIVGGGLSGALVAMQLLRRGAPDLEIVLVERGPRVGRGLAYGVESALFRLNVPASRMSVDPEQPNDFVTWAKSEGAPNAFLARVQYGDYVEARLAEATRASVSALRIVRGDVVSIRDGAVLLSDGSRIPASFVVLATGLAPRALPSALPRDARIVDAWDERAMAALPASGKLLILGAGLTAIDVIAHLDARTFAGRATILSRRGLLPGAHIAPPDGLASPLRAELALDLPRTLRALVVWGRKVVREAQARGEPWQHAIDSIRPYVGRIWRGLPAYDRARFVRSVRPYWDVLRHRAPPDMRALIERGRARGLIETIAGSVLTCEPVSGELEVVLRMAGGTRRRERYDMIVCCIGPAVERSEAETPLVRDLIASGRASADPAGLGISTDEEGRVVRPTGAPDRHLFAIGALRRASGWETTSVPDISAHALAIAKQIVP